MVLWQSKNWPRSDCWKSIKTSSNWTWDLQCSQNSLRLKSPSGSSVEIFPERINQNIDTCKFQSIEVQWRWRVAVRSFCSNWWKNLIRHHCRWKSVIRKTDCGHTWRLVLHGTWQWRMDYRKLLEEMGWGCLLIIVILIWTFIVTFGFKSNQCCGQVAWDVLIGS